MEIEKYLKQIQEDNIQEFDPLTLGVALATIAIVKELVYFFIFVSNLASQMKENTDLSKKLNSTLVKIGNKKNFTVHVVPNSIPNAFTPGGKHVYITKGLLKLLTPEEIQAVLLHEVYHAKEKHVYKKMAVEFPFYYIAAPIAIAASIGVAPILGPFSFIIGVAVFSIIISTTTLPLKILMGRKQEYNADNYAVQAGYGNQLSSSLIKLEKELKKYNSKSQCGKICQVVEKINNKLDEHPETKKRVEVTLKNTELLKSLTKRNIKNIVYKVKNIFEKGK